MLKKPSFCCSIPVPHQRKLSKEKAKSNHQTAKTSSTQRKNLCYKHPLLGFFIAIVFMIAVFLLILFFIQRYEIREHPHTTSEDFPPFTSAPPPLIGFNFQ